MNRFFLGLDEIEVRNLELEYALSDAELKSLNKGNIGGIRFVPHKEIGSAGGGEIFIAFLLPVLQQCIATGMMDMLEMQIKCIFDKFAVKYKNYIDPTPFIILSVCGENSELELNLGNVTDSDELKKYNTDKAIEFLIEYSKINH